MSLINYLKKSKNIVSCFVTKDDVILNQELLFVINEDKSTELYLYPEFIQIYGSSSHTKNHLSQSIIGSYDTRMNNSDSEVNKYHDYYYRTLEKAKDKFNTISDYRYFSNLYSDADNKNSLSAIHGNRVTLEQICHEERIHYESNPSVIMQSIITTLVNNPIPKEPNISIDFNAKIDYCTSTENINEYTEERLSNIKGIRELNEFSESLSGLAYGADHYLIGNYSFKLLDNTYLLQIALNNPRYPKRKEIIKTYTEFAIVFPYFCHILETLQTNSRKVALMKDKLKLQSYYEHPEFIAELESLANHKGEETLYYHATQDESCAKNIIDKGLYCYSGDITSTTFENFNLKQILSYEYGNGFRNYGDYMIVASSLPDENIVRKLTPEEREKANIVARRMALSASKPGYIIDPSHILGYIDKKHFKFIHNEQYKIESNKEL